MVKMFLEIVLKHLNSLIKEPNFEVPNETNGLAICYENGYVVAQNMSKEIEYYEKSAKLGNEKAKK